MELKTISKQGVSDTYFDDENGNRIASLLRNANGRGYFMFIHLKVKDYEPVEYGTRLQANTGLRRLLIKMAIRSERSLKPQAG